ncbi:fumarylacetoacetase [Solicola gregarius]|uniref:fumarylacetoacetase n=1 Tax=Solicola gregarius TaxID=2908642 RepID=A0AA46TDW5_9ACTN|nr:fumarylacetoacetase [Solicola gregarius]UYM03534.1 fumarylacetoacetase [Solicola gregarius]
MTTWVPGAAGSLYDTDNLPYGVVSRGGEAPRVAVRIGEYALDVAPVAALGGDPGDGPHLAAAWDAPTLNPFLALGRDAWRIAREWLMEILTDDIHRAGVEPHLYPLADVRTHLPIEIGDYVDFYASIDHATNLGRFFRPDSEPLLPNWRHLPIGYHGRSGTIVASDTTVVRPMGQRKPPADDAPTFGPTQRLDIEAELGFVVGTPSAHGERVPTEAFADHVFGAFLLNDWSARDIQGWEAQPLGPFLGKSFATSIAAWVTPLEALEAARVDLPVQDPSPLDYLRTGGRAGYDIDVTVALNGTTVARTPYAAMYWSPAQMLAHLTVNGASVRTGDVYASGTISGPGPGQRGSLLELSGGGREPFRLDDGTEHTFLQDGDEVVLTATAPGATGTRVGLAEVRGRIGAAR